MKQNDLLSLVQRRRTPDFFVCMKYIISPQVKAEHNPHPYENLRDALLRDSLTRAVEGDDESLQLVIENINTYVELVHHTDYPLALMQCRLLFIAHTGRHGTHHALPVVGLSLASLTRKTADMHHTRFDPSSLLLLACTLIQHNKAHSRVSSH